MHVSSDLIHWHLTLVYDLERGDLLWVGVGRTAQALETFLDALTPETLGNDAQLRLKSVLEANETISSVYALKEQLQALWQATSETDMQARLDQWCELAGSTHLTALKP